MSTVRMNGKELSNKILEEIKKETIELKEKGITPGLAVILVGEDPASQIYVRKKDEACKELGFNSKVFNYPSSISQKELVSEIERINDMDEYDAILCQLPLPAHINPKIIAETIAEHKDVDVLRDSNLGKILTNENIIAPCTPSGIIRLLDEYQIETEGKHCVMVGRSNIVGKPMALMMLHRNSTVTICHSKTKNLKDICLTADILIVAVGKENLITEDMIKEGAVVIDVGINRDENNKVCGDVSRSAYEKTSYITPVPGGVGPMTISILMQNTLILAKNNKLK